MLFIDLSKSPPTRNKMIAQKKRRIRRRRKNKPVLATLMVNASSANEKGSTLLAPAIGSNLVGKATPKIDIRLNPARVV